MGACVRAWARVSVACTLGVHGLLAIFAETKLREALAGVVACGVQTLARPARICSNHASARSAVHTCCMQRFNMQPTTLALRALAVGTECLASTGSGQLGLRTYITHLCECTVIPPRTDRRLAEADRSEAVTSLVLGRPTRWAFLAGRVHGVLPWFAETKLREASAGFIDSVVEALSGPARVVAFAGGARALRA